MTPDRTQRLNQIRERAEKAESIEHWQCIALDLSEKLQKAEAELDKTGDKTVDYINKLRERELELLEECNTLRAQLETVTQSYESTHARLAESLKHHEEHHRREQDLLQQLEIARKELRCDHSPSCGCLRGEKCDCSWGSSYENYTERLEKQLETAKAALDAIANANNGECDYDGLCFYARGALAQLEKDSPRPESRSGANPDPTQAPVKDGLSTAGENPAGELDRLRKQVADLRDALEWQLPKQEDCGKCETVGGLCVGHAALEQSKQDNK